MKHAALVLVGVVMGCAHVPEELSAARKDYVNAQPAADLSEARTALDLATKEFERDGDSARLRELATIARRRIDTANSRARLANDQAYLEVLTAEATRLKERQNDADRDIEAQAAALPPVPTVVEPKQVVATTTVVPGETPPIPSPETEAMPDLPTVSPALESLTFAKVTNDVMGTVITVPAALVFAAGKPGLSREAQARLDEIVVGLRDANERISIEVHTDSIGSHVNNQQLSAKRARAVRDYLVGKGISSQRIEAHGLGDTRPLVENDTAKNREVNRRLEIVLRPVPVS